MPRSLFTADADFLTREQAKALADRALSRLLKQDWPRDVEALDRDG